jgi:hypothetical protein
MDFLDYVAHYFDILIHPSAELAREKKNADWREGFKSYALLGMIVGLTWGIILSAILVVVGSFAQNLLPDSIAWMAGLGVVAILVLPILGAIFQIISSVVFFGIMWLISAKILGGKSTFTQILYLQSRLLWPTIFAAILIAVVMIALYFILPAIILLLTPLFILMIIVGIGYALYLQFLLILTANDFSKMRAGISLLLYLIVIILLNVGPLLLPTQTSDMITSNSLMGVINPVSIPGDLCDAKFGPFTVSQSEVTPTATSFVLVNQTGQPVEFLSVDMTGTNGEEAIAMKQLSVSGTGTTMAPNETKTVTIAHSSPLKSGKYAIVYKLAYNAGAISGIYATGECRGTI